MKLRIWNWIAGTQRGACRLFHAAGRRHRGPRHPRCWSDGVGRRRFVPEPARPLPRCKNQFRPQARRALPWLEWPTRASNILILRSRIEPALSEGCASDRAEWGKKRRVLTRRIQRVLGRPSGPDFVSGHDFSRAEKSGAQRLPWFGRVRGPPGHAATTEPPASRPNSPKSPQTPICGKFVKSRPQNPK